MSVKLLILHHLKFLSCKGGCTGSSEATLVKMPHCWISHVAAHFILFRYFTLSHGFGTQHYPIIGPLSVKQMKNYMCDVCQSNQLF